MMTRYGIAAALCAALAACGGGGGAPSPLPPPSTATIPDLGLYLAQARCPDGSPPFQCANPVPQRGVDAMLWRRTDGFGQREDSVVADTGAYWITTWAYGDGPFSSDPLNDGGEVYVSDGRAVTICCTQDGGHPGILQRFASPPWWLFDNTVPTGAWGDGPNRQTRATRATVTFPATGFGLTSITADTIISEAYSAPGYSGAGMERFYMGAGWGRLAWVAFAPAGTHTPSADFPQRCPADSPMLAPPDVQPAWVAYDCRIVTHLAPADGSMSVDLYGWPPAEFSP